MRALICLKRDMSIYSCYTNFKLYKVKKIMSYMGLVCLPVCYPVLGLSHIVLSQILLFVRPFVYPINVPNFNCNSILSINVPLKYEFLVLLSTFCCVTGVFVDWLQA